MGIETIPGVPLCGFMRVYALVKRTEAHRNPSQLLQTATTRRQWQARKKGQGKRDRDRLANDVPPHGNKA